MSCRDSSLSPRKRPRQARSQHTVDCIVEGAARVFRREGWGATTNRIAEEAGVSIGSLYEYFPNKQALLAELAERHVAEAEQELGAAIEDRGRATLPLLRSVQRAIIRCQRYPSQALGYVSEPTRSDLAERASALRLEVLSALTEHVRTVRPDAESPHAIATAVFGMIGDLTSQAVFDPSWDGERDLAPHWLAMAVAYLEPTRDPT